MFLVAGVFDLNINFVCFNQFLANIVLQSCLDVIKFEFFSIFVRFCHQFCLFIEKFKLLLAIQFASVKSLDLNLKNLPDPCLVLGKAISYLCY